MRQTNYSPTRYQYVMLPFKSLNLTKIKKAMTYRDSGNLSLHDKKSASKIVLL